MLTAVLAQLDGSAFAQADEHLHSAITVIEEQESSIRSVAFQVNFSNESFRRSNGRWQVVDSDTLERKRHFGIVGFEAICKFELAASRLDVDLKSHESGFLGDGITPLFSASESRFIDDGRQFVRYDRKRFTTQASEPDWRDLPENWNQAVPFRSHATIDDRAQQGRHLQDNLGFLELYAGRLGFGWVTPLLSPSEKGSVRLSELLNSRIEEGEKVLLTETSDENWEFKFGFPYGFRVIYSPEFQRVVNAQWGGCHKCPDPEMTPGNWLVQAEVQFEYDGESRIPAAVSVIKDIYAAADAAGGYESRDKNGYRFLYSHGQLNPSLQFDVSGLLFDKGTTVDNYITQKIYEEGVTLADDERATLQFLMTHNLISDDDPRLIPGGPAGPGTGLGAKRSVALWINAGVAVFAAAFFLAKALKQRRGRK